MIALTERQQTLARLQELQEAGARREAAAAAQLQVQRDAAARLSSEVSNANAREEVDRLLGCEGVMPK